VMIGSMMVPRPVYVYPVPPPPQHAAPATQQCPDGSVIPVGSYCPAPPQAAPAPAPAPAPERGERG
jgi:hypothetical protein